MKPNTVGATPNPANPGALTGLEVRCACCGVGGAGWGVEGGRSNGGRGRKFDVHYLQGFFIHPRWLFEISEPSTALHFRNPM